MTLMTAVAVGLLLQGAPAKAPATAASELPVTVTYTGKGTIDASHRVIVFLFADGDITSASRPLDRLYVTKSGETVTFKNVTTPVYVFALLDTTGGYDGVSAPPPAGVPSATYRKPPKGPPTAVKAGAPIKFTFDDSERWSR